MLAPSDNLHLLFIPTYLYIKQHFVTGKLYFGKTTRKDPVNYLGSGKYWKRHIKVHGKDQVKTFWYCLFTEQEELTKFALMCSEQWNIVKSDQWLNFKPENGLDGGGHPGIKRSAESIAKSVASNTGKKRSEETKAKMRKPKIFKGTIGKHKLGIPRSDEEKRKLSEALTGRIFAEETKQKMSDSAKKRPKEQYEKIASGRRQFYIDARAERLIQPPKPCEYCKKLQAGQFRVGRFCNETCYRAWLNIQKIN